MLTNQVDQRFVALLTTEIGDAAAVTASPVLDVEQLWRFESDDDQ